MDVDRILIALGELKADWNSRFDRLEQRVSELEKRPFPSGRAR